MPGKLNSYTLGEFGVNRVKSPIHLLDGELLIAQNAEIPPVTGNRGLRKRAGMSLLNAEAAAGSILSMSLIPLPDPTDDALGGPGLIGRIEIFVDGANTTRTTTDGTTWANKNVAARGAGFSGNGPPKSYFYNGSLYYVADTLGQIRAYNGTADTLEATVPAAHPANASPLTAIIGFCGLGNKLFVLAFYDSPYVQVMQTTIGTGVVSTFCEGFKTTVGAETGFLLRTNAVGLVAWNGSVWAGAYDSTGVTGYLYRAGSGDSAWTADEAFVARRLASIGQAGTSLFMTTVSSGGGNYQVERRDVDSSLTTVLSSAVSQPAAVAVHDERVYVINGGDLMRSTNNGGAFTTIATGTIGSSSGLVGKITKIGTTYYLFLNTEFIRDDGASVTEIAVGGGSFLSGMVRF